MVPGVSMGAFMLSRLGGAEMGKWKAIGCILVVLGIIRVIYHVMTAQIILGMDVPRSIGSRYVEAWQIYLRRKRNIKTVIKNGRS